MASSSADLRLVAEGPPRAVARPLLDPREDFAAVYEAHYPAVYRAVRGVVLDPVMADDVTQDAFLRAYRASASPHDD